MIVEPDPTMLMALVKVNAVPEHNSDPPARVMVFVPALSAAFTCKVPLLTTVPPEWELAEARNNMPGPVFVRRPGPTIAPACNWFVLEVTSMVAWFGFMAGWEHSRSPCRKMRGREAA